MSFGRIESGVTISRIRHGTETTIVREDTRLHLHDLLTVVGTSKALGHFERVIGQRSEEDITVEESNITFRRVAVTDNLVVELSPKKGEPILAALEVERE